MARSQVSSFCLLFLAIFSVSLVTSQKDSNDVEKYLVRLQALGRTARLGSLYNASTETFTEISILNKNLPDNLVTTIGTPSTNTRFGLVKAFSDKSSLLDVSASLTLSILSGKVEVSGSGRYMHDEQKKSNSVVGSLSYETLTYEDVLEIFFDEMRDFLSPAVLENATESHVVIGIGWGANVIVKFEDQNEDGRDVTQVQRAMSVALNMVGFGISGEANVNVSESDMQSFSNYSLQIFGDINFDASDYPTDVTKVVNLIEKIPKLVNNSNEGKGKQLFFYLVPLDKVREFFKYNGTVETPPTEELPPEEVASQIDVFEQIAIVKLKLNDLYTSMMRNRDILNNTDLHQMHDLRNGFLNSTVTYRKALRRGLTDYSTGRQRDISSIRSIEWAMRAGDSSLEITENAIDNNFQEARLKIEFVEFLRSQGAIWVGRGDNVDVSIIKIFKADLGTTKSICWIHFFHKDLRNTILFLEPVLDSIKKGSIPLIMDCDFPHVTCESPIYQNKTCATLYTPKAFADEEIVRDIDDVKQDTHMLKKEVQSLKSEVKRMNEEEAIPVGFIYTELPGQSTPSKIWPQYTWTGRSSKFAGDFFRVVGGKSSSFGETQPSSSGGLRQMTTYKCALGSLFCSVYSSIELAHEEGGEKVEGIRSRKIPIGPVNGSTVFIDFLVSSEESRPVNKAVRIWERTG